MLKSLNFLKFLLSLKLEVNDLLLRLLLTSRSHFVSNQACFLASLLLLASRTIILNLNKLKFKM